ncbi:hypothetical protein [Variovorax sp. J22R115]|uniref:hypothetical protein n=1 Tax=Variovorax sp. J22R115 TaxID=3053509 RepID=UPI002576A2DA|nr:hypothetical protein [Variovorax sp. J22R115]MDM0048240.1 hypothetical protein [Variovorax sp. J22R115]
MNRRNWIAVASAEHARRGRDSPEGGFMHMGNGFVPWRRDVRYAVASEAPILPLIDRFDFVEDPRRWGYRFRFGLFEVNEHDMRLIAGAMKASPRALAL